MRRQPNPLPPPTAPPSEPSPVDPNIWRACAGASVQIPTVNSRVYYFPQGHLDQASSPPNSLSHNLYNTPFVLSTIVDVQFLADHKTDEVFAKLLLHPLNRSSSNNNNSDYQFHHPPPPPSPSAPVAASEGKCSSGTGGGDDDENAIVSFAKILTPSDANNGGGFSVPRFCADSIFPPLNFQEDPPYQNLKITDVHGMMWGFRHIYRGTPRRHLLTTGWSRFVNFKNIVAGDSVVFMKNSKGDLFAGVRRAKRPSSRDSGGSGGSAEWRRAMLLTVGGVRSRADEGEEKKQTEEKVVKEGFRRNGKGKLAPEKVAEAAELAAQGMPFEVVYYPSTGSSDFVVKAEIVDEAMRVVWSPGVRVKMAVETEDSSRMSWFQGTVSALCVPENGQWRGSPWRMLQVAWDEPEVLPNAKLVSPWQVELLSPSPILHTAFPPAKRFKAGQGSELLADREGDPFINMTGFTNSTMGHFNQPLLTYGPFPAGMQGARHDAFPSSNLYNFPIDNSHLCLGNQFGNNTALRLNPINPLSTELNIGSPQSDKLSPDSQGSSMHSIGTDFAGTRNGISEKPRSRSFQLFGATIETIQPVESVLHGAGCTGKDSCKGCNENKGVDKLEYSLAYKEVLNKLDELDGRCQRGSAVGPYHL